MPVPGCSLEAEVMFGLEMTLDGAQQADQQEGRADDHMGAVEAGGHEECRRVDAIGEIERLHVFYKELMNMPALDRESEKDFKQIASSRSKMEAELANDFNVPGATSELFHVIRYFNREFISTCDKGISEKLRGELVSLLNFYSDATGLLYENYDEVLGHINHARKSLNDSSETLTDGEVENLIKERKEARANKDWAKSDQIRDKLNEAGIVVKDNPDGTYSWHYK